MKHVPTPDEDVLLASDLLFLRAKFAEYREQHPEAFIPPLPPPSNVKLYKGTKVFKPITCLHCSTMVTPVHGRQRFHPACGLARKRAANTMRRSGSVGRLTKWYHNHMAKQRARAQKSGASSPRLFKPRECKQCCVTFTPLCGNQRFHSEECWAIATAKARGRE